MRLLLRFSRWRALRGIPRWTPATPEGRRVHVTGIVRRLDEPFTAPLANVECVVVHTRYSSMGGGGDGKTPAPTSGKVERLQLAPFALEMTSTTIVVDASHARLVLPPSAPQSTERELMFLAPYSLHKTSGTFEEMLVTDGQIITVVGTVLRDGVELPHSELAFRDATATCKLVGNRHHPIVIVEPA